MPDDRDHYEAYYADKLWNLLPTIYRAGDTLEAGRSGPLREMANRIGAQAAIVRRSLDRLWEDQSIETCDDWVIAYIGGLLGTNLVQSLDARGQRLDVANTIDYRRRKGTVALLEQLAADITGWDARVVEYFRRMVRTRHNLDLELAWSSPNADGAGDPAVRQALQLTGVQIGASPDGWADLRDAPAASRTNSAFDAFSHTADLRTSPGGQGRYNIPSLGIYLWRLRSIPVERTTPVQDAANPGEYTFDPTGRDIPLFAAVSRAYRDEWVSPEEWQLPVPISQRLLQAEFANLYAALDPEDDTTLQPHSLGIFRRENGAYPLVQRDRIGVAGDGENREFRIDPERGRLILRDPVPGSFLQTSYHYGSVSNIGAGSFDRRIAGNPPGVAPDRTVPVLGGAGALSAALQALAGPRQGQGTIHIADSRTYTAAFHLDGIRQVTIRAENHRRPLIRLPIMDCESPDWIFTGLNEESALTLDGLFLSGGDVVLRGTFDRVDLSCCTLDPGSAGRAPRRYALSADGRDLRPTRLRIEGTVRRLTLTQCITGPIGVSGDGDVEVLTLTDSIVQAINRGRARREMTIQTASGEVHLCRCTLLGPARVHRLNASECILDDFVRVRDLQRGCVRFCAWTEGSLLPGPYASVMVPARSPLFNSRTFGHPAYAQLRLSVETGISEGAEDGSEMGAFAREKYSIKERSLRIKYAEYLPLGLMPVILYIT